MSRVYNFCAGPAAIPEPVLQQVKEELLDWNGLGVSVMELSHRSSQFLDLIEEIEQDLRDLMAIPDNYKVLFLPGGATGQFAAVATNLLGKTGKAGYVNSGHWSHKAIIEAKRHGDITVIASNEESGWRYFPKVEEWKIPKNLDYIHYTMNETVNGVQLYEVPDTGDIPCVVDVSSCILSDTIDVSRFGLLYAGAQKNMGPSGITVVIVRDDLLDQQLPSCPTLMNYKKQVAAGSMLNTPPTFSWYMLGLTYKWLKNLGGVEAIAKVNHRKAQKLYAAVDESRLFTNQVEESSRSIMNVVFDLPTEVATRKFIKESAQNGLCALKGHKVVGGIRASIYNAVPEIAVDKLIAFMKDFDTAYDE